MGLKSHLTAIAAVCATVGCLHTAFPLHAVTPRQPVPVLSEPNVYLNRARGYAPLVRAGAEGLVLTAANTAESDFFNIRPCADDFKLSFRTASRSSQSGAALSMLRRTPDAWGFSIACSDGDTIRYSVRKTITGTDGRDALEVVIESPDTIVGAVATEGADLWNGVNIWRLERKGETATLSCGNRGTGALVTVSMPCEISGIGFTALPGTRLTVTDIAFERTQPLKRHGVTLAELEKLTVRLGEDDDPLTGEWDLYDYSLDDTRHRLGGQYRLIAVRDGESYELLIMDGARVGSSLWGAGTVKARLVPSRHKGVYRVEWFTAEGTVAEGEAAAQLAGEGMLEIQFPASGSVLRFRMPDN